MLYFSRLIICCSWQYRCNFIIVNSLALSDSERLQRPHYQICSLGVAFPCHAWSSGAAEQNGACQLPGSCGGRVLLAEVFGAGAGLAAFCHSDCSSSIKHKWWLALLCAELGCVCNASISHEHRFESRLYLLPDVPWKAAENDPGFGPLHP